MPWTDCKDSEKDEQGGHHAEESVKPLSQSSASLPQKIKPAVWLQANESDPGPRNKESSFHAPPHIDLPIRHVI
jgi:hypothetical protein